MKAKKSPRTRVTLRIPNDLARRLTQVSVHAAVSLEDVVNVLLALEVARATERAKAQ